MHEFFNKNEEQKKEGILKGNIQFREYYFMELWYVCVSEYYINL